MRKLPRAPSIDHCPLASAVETSLLSSVDYLTSCEFSLKMDLNFRSELYSHIVTLTISQALLITVRSTSYSLIEPSVHPSGWSRFIHF